MVQIDNNHYMQGYKFMIYPTKEQMIFIDKCINANIFVYNWALEQEEIQYKKFKDGLSDISFYNQYDLDKLFTEYRKENEWISELPHVSIRNSIKRVISSFKRFFKGISKYPKYKSKKKMKTLSYNPRYDRFFFEDNMLRIEGLPKNEMILSKFHTGFTKSDNIKFYNPVISKDKFGNYFVSFNLLSEKPTNYFSENNIIKYDRAIGIDLNVKNRIVLSTGKYIKHQIVIN